LATLPSKFSIKKLTLIFHNVQTNKNVVNTFSRNIFCMVHLYQIKSKCIFKTNFNLGSRHWVLSSTDT